MGILKYTAYRALRLASEMINGNHAEPYRHCQDYPVCLTTTNPNSCIYIAKDEDFFKRMYVRLEACKEGFLVGCRHVISVDAYHLKDPFGGQLFCAVGKDVNDDTFPIAFAMAGNECKASWTGFWEQLLDDVAMDDQRRWVFILDRQKGLLDALDTLVTFNEHRYCFKHLHPNIKEKGHAFSTHTKSDVLVNNIAESFNTLVLEARDKPILTMIETIRGMLMNRFRVKGEVLGLTGWPHVTDDVILPAKIKRRPKRPRKVRRRVEDEPPPPGHAVSRRGYITKAHVGLLDTMRGNATFLQGRTDGSIQENLARRSLHPLVSSKEKMLHLGKQSKSERRITMKMVPRHPEMGKEGTWDLEGVEGR
ncbi:hypothetical protein CJ030_MR7G017829 [Morella rubra]|uniref:MULE transposase domain-containing protein n=1 Tax=Morella rubra TaxID=262757 RepID=A0A6A1V1B4_9ROSI|nr:hypothetical protein CJ030_MR7G017829 [Morella rubra]